MKMNIDFKTEEEWIIHSLNIQGGFFEVACQNVIEKLPDWELALKGYPLEWKSKTGELDILAKNVINGVIKTVIIECKKNNPEFVNWVFFESKIKKQLLPQLIAELKEDKIEFSANIASLKPNNDVANFGWEVRGNYAEYKKGDKTRTISKNIQDACEQAILGLKVIFQEEIDKLEYISKNSAKELPFKKQIFIPIVVTTANLFICKFDSEKINLETGEINFSETKLEPRDFVIYDYPVPKIYQFSPTNKYSPELTSDSGLLSRLSIFIVNSKSFEKLLTSMK